MDELRSHPFFSQRIPSSLPSSVTISEPIWSTDEFGEIHAIKPTSALDIIFSKASSSETTTKKTVGNTLEKLDNVLPTKISTKLPTPMTAGSSSTTPKFNIYDDVSETNESIPATKLPNQSSVVNGNTIDTKRDDFGPSHDSTPVNRLTDKMASCGFDEARELPPSSADSPCPFDSNPVGSSSATSPQSHSPKGQGSSDDMSELEQVHSRLTECLSNYERVQNGGSKVERTISLPTEGSDMWGATKWVTRYVDYTSKYGLGFLLNDGW